jgi:hypothetical protein
LNHRVFKSRKAAVKSTFGLASGQISKASRSNSARVFRGRLPIFFGALFNLALSTMTIIWRYAVFLQVWSGRN